jgi:hypothetical protein
VLYGSMLPSSLGLQHVALRRTPVVKSRLSAASAAQDRRVGRSSQVRRLRNIQTQGIYEVNISCWRLIKVSDQTTKWPSGLRLVRISCVRQRIPSPQNFTPILESRPRFPASVRARVTEKSNYLNCHLMNEQRFCVTAKLSWTSGTHHGNMTSVPVTSVC